MGNAKIRVTQAALAVAWLEGRYREYTMRDDVYRFWGRDVGKWPEPVYLKISKLNSPMFPDGVYMHNAVRPLEKPTWIPVEIVE